MASNRLIEHSPETAAPHPEEMKATFELRIGDGFLKGSARATPAGIIAVGVTAVAIAGSIVWVRAQRSKQSSSPAGC